MELVFYLLQLVIPEQLSEASQGASISSLQLAQASYYSQVHYEAEKVCMLRIIYTETTNEPIKGKQVVAAITMNRVNSGKFPNTVCDNMKAKGAYSFYSSKTKERVRRYPKIYHEIAEKALQGGYSKLISPSVTYFKVCSVKSKFFDTLVMVGKVGNHCMYQEKVMLAKN